MTQANPEWYVQAVSQRHRGRWIFIKQCHVTTSSWIKIFIHTGLRTGFYGRDLIHESLYTLLHFSSHQRNKFLYFCSTIVNNVFLFINISILHNQVSFAFQHKSPWGLHNSSLSVAEFESQWSKSYQHQIWDYCMNFSARPCITLQLKWKAGL